jgi:hypothetical protein
VCPAGPRRPSITLFTKKNSVSPSYNIASNAIIARYLIPPFQDNRARMALLVCQLDYNQGIRVQFLAGQEVSLFCTAGSGAQPASYPMGTGSFFSEGKTAET